MRTDGKPFVELYLDTSALVKLYLAEPDHDAVISAVRVASGIATSLVAYAEARAAFARRLRENTLTVEAHDAIVTAFNDSWHDLDRVELSDDIVYSAGDIAQQHALRGFDAIHLASAIWLHNNVDNLHFMAFDARLMAVARQLLATYEIH